MSYISSQEVAQKRKELKLTFPNLKLSVTGRDHAVISVTILSGPKELTPPNRVYESINHFYIAKNYKEEPVKRKTLERIYDIINTGNSQITYDSDYGSIPQFYTRISIGEWDKPYQIK